MRIKFTSDPKLPRDIAHLGYRKDLEVELSIDQAERWLRRGVAVVVPVDAATPEPGPEEFPPSDPASAGLRLLHAGGGRWHVVGLDDVKLTDRPLPKAEAEAFMANPPNVLVEGAPAPSDPPVA